MYGEKRLYSEAVNATLNLKQTARRSSYLTFGRYACANNIPTTRLRSAELEVGVPRGNPLARFLRLLAMFDVFALLVTQNDGVAVKANSPFIFRLRN